MRLNNKQAMNKRLAKLSMIAYIPIIVILAIIILAMDKGNPLIRVLEMAMIPLATLTVINTILLAYYKTRYDR